MARLTLQSAPDESETEDRAPLHRRPKGRRKRRPRKLVWIVPVVLVLLAVVAAAGYAAYRQGFWFAQSASTADETTVVYSGDEATLAVASGNTVQKDQRDPTVTWIRSSRRMASAAAPTDGVALKLSPSLVNKISGRMIKVTISAADPSAETPVPPFALAYAGDAGTSGWIIFIPSKQFDTYSFLYQVPLEGAGQANYIAIWADISGTNRPLAVRDMTVAIAR
jgi:hypothetical protein